MLLFKCIFTLAFISVALFSSTPFYGDITDKNYVLQQGIGQVVKTDSSEATNGKVWVTVYKFNASGFIIEKKEEGLNNLTTQYSYDKSGNLTESTTTRVNGALYATETMVYDMNNRIIESRIRKVAEKITTNDKYEWIDDSTRHTTRVYNGISSRFITSYDANHRLVDESFENGTGNTWVYDGDLLLMKKNKVGSPNIERYEYDENHRVKLIDNSFSRKTFEYDSKGRVSKSVTKDDNERTLAWERYQY